jgi:hypothetical protein
MGERAASSKYSESRTQSKQDTYTLNDVFHQVLITCVRTQTCTSARNQSQSFETNKAKIIIASLRAFETKSKQRSSREIKNYAKQYTIGEEHLHSMKSSVECTRTCTRSTQNQS